MHRYKGSWWTRTALNAISEKLGGLFHHKYCPAIIGEQSIA
jgi:hypothetical protein